MRSQKCKQNFIRPIMKLKTRVMSTGFFVSHIIIFVDVILNVCRNKGLQHVQPAQRTTTEL